MLLLRWSLRDLRRKWLQVAAIALVIAIGSGLFSALDGTAAWRYATNDASFGATGMYDLRVKTTAGLDAAQGEMLAVLEGVAGPGEIIDAEERLVVDTQVDASTNTESIRVPGRLVGLDLTDNGPALTSVAVNGHGRTLTETDTGTSSAVLERNFAEYYGLSAPRRVTIGGGGRLDVVGIGMAPEYFFITSDDGGFFAEANFAALFVSLETAQRLVGRPGRVNDLVVRITPATDVEQLQVVLQRAFDDSSTGLGVTVMLATDEPTYRVLYDDIEGDRTFWTIFAGLILAGAALGAFNLSARMVEAQRRELGIGMALGASRLQLALRPMLVGLEIAVASVVLGFGVAMLAIALLRPVYSDMLPMPVWVTDFQWVPFAQGAGLGFVIPLVSTAWPVWRSVRMAPVDAISTTHRRARSGLSRMLRVLPWPRGAFRRMPLGNVLRAPRRTALTALGIGAALATLVAIFGMIDSFAVTMARNDVETLGASPDRVIVGLDSIVLENGPEVAAVREATTVGAVSPVLQLGGRLDVQNSVGTARAGERGFDVLLEAIDLDTSLWVPTLTEQVDGAGIVISEAAAHDLGVTVGDTLDLTHPSLSGTDVTMITTPVAVVGLHPSPFRFNVYFDRTLLTAFGASGLTNELFVVPAAGHTTDDVERELFDLPAVSSIAPAATAGQIVRDSLRRFTGVFRVAEGFILALVLLIAYNAASINADERARERATLFAFGLPVYRVLGLEIAEALVYGVLGTGVGLGIGAWINQWLMSSVMKSTAPEMTLDIVISTSSLLTAVTLGVIAVGIAPLLTVRRMRRMDVPSTLRVVE
jgi:putative ABC transport system permease protein